MTTLWTVGVLTESMQARPFTEVEARERKARRYRLRMETRPALADASSTIEDSDSGTRPTGRASCRP